MIEELKPCPFCGSPAHSGHQKYGWFVECDIPCGGFMGFNQTEESAVQDWNKRFVDLDIPDRIRIPAHVDLQKQIDTLTEDKQQYELTIDNLNAQIDRLEKEKKLLSNECESEEKYAT